MAIDNPVTLPTAAIGWVALDLEKLDYRAGEFGKVDDLIERHTADLDPQDGWIEIAAYRTDEAYVGSQGHSDGMTREEHSLLVSRKAEELAEQGWNVRILEMLA